jgi:S-(hydroxymethyl)glutathione dehydrogenase/alcohol dehydrogenase
MKAAVLTQLDSPLAILDVEAALPLSFGQVLVRVLTAGICGAQLQEIRGEKGGPIPHLMGHEGCGLVESIGPGVTRVKPGDKVVMHWRKAAGIESEYPKYKYSEGTLINKPSADQSPEIGSPIGSQISVPSFTSGLVTTWAEQTICSENRLTPVPADTDPTLATLLGCSLSTALATVESEARWGERVLVIGCGGLGLSLLAALDRVEPRTLCACDIQEDKRLPAEIAGADFIAVSELSPFAQHGPFDLILDTAGAADTTEAALERLAPSGRYVMIGQPKPGKPVCIRNARHFFDAQADGEGKTLKATQGGGFRPDLDIPRYLKIAQGMRLWPLVTHTFQLEKINEALDLVRAGGAGRVLIEIAPQSKPAEDPAAMITEWVPGMDPRLAA